MTGKYDFRSEPSKELELIDQEPVAEEHHFATIYDELLFKRSHNNPDYIDPAAAAKIIAKQVDERFKKYHEECRTAEIDFRNDLFKIFHGRNLMESNKEVVKRRRKNVSRMWGK